MLIKLINSDQVAEIDDEDYEKVSSFEWRIQVLKYTDIKYARSLRWVKGKQTCTYMHRIILGVVGRPTKVDHIDSNGLNNKKCNLRKCTHSENMYNRRKGKNNTSGFIGVNFCKKNKINPWRAEIKCEGVRYRGAFASAQEAAIFRDRMAKWLHGDYARLNFPDLVNTLGE